MIPLVATPAPRPNFGELLTGESSRFNVDNGSWTNSGGTLTWDSTSTYRWGGSTGSLKHAWSGTGQYSEVTLSGTFKSGVAYCCFLALSFEQNTADSPAWEVEFGLIGTDRVTSGNQALYVDGGLNEGRITTVGLRWVPSADRTGVKVRVTSRATTARTLHVSQARVYRIPDDRKVLPLDASSAFSSTFGWMPHIRLSSGATNIALGQSGGLSLGPSANYLENDSLSTPYAGLWVSSTEVGIECDHATLGDMPGEGVWFLIGSGGLGLYLSEKDTTTLQMYSDTADNMTQLRHRGNGGWAVSPDGTVNGRIEAYFDWVFTKSGALTVATNVALPYYRTPYKARITEVQIHVGTAPTGTNVIVDVNDDGTTIFTTQGNRPEIAVSTNDDTSGTPDGGTSVAAGSVITVDVDQIGSGTAGSDLTVQVRGYYIW